MVNLFNLFYGSIFYSINLVNIVNQWVKMKKAKYKMYLPWTEPPLVEWSIVGMNHYHVKGYRCLFVAMVKDGVCIKAEGPSSELVFIDLKRQANRHNERGDLNEKAE